MSYDFAINLIEIKEIRYRSTDTIYVSASVAVAGREPRTIIRRLGDHGKGNISPDVVVRNIPLADTEVAVFCLRHHEQWPFEPRCR